uniref:Receptor kinase-like protein Xa21 n=1 Tax=Oryza meridionalis TaxID=40149 RepID=A0A0E0CHJ8_9ORYZ
MQQLIHTFLPRVRKQFSFGQKAVGTIIGIYEYKTTIAAPIQYLSLEQNKLTGGIPASLGNLSSLVHVSLKANNLVGSIPKSLSKIPTLERLVLTYNNLTGHVPQAIFNISSLKYLSMANNSLIGQLPPDIGNRLPNLEALILSTTQLNGPIPASLRNMSKLEMVYLAAAGLTGIVPSFGSLPNLHDLDLGYSQLEAGDWSFLSSLANCTQLKKLALDANLPSQLNWLWLRQNKLSGTIPSEIGNLKSLSVLYLDENMFSGSIPPTIGNLSNLLVLSLAQNNLSGLIPDSIGNLAQLTEFHLDGNNFNGSIPSNLGQWRQLEKLDFSHNSFGGSLPSEVFNISSLSQSLDLSHNLFTGPIPLEIGNLINLGSISISNNRLTGEIPSTLGKCVLLEYLHMEGNLLTGSIPRSFMNLKSIKELDLSCNSLSGKVPEFLTLLSSLQKLNLSFNDFEGPIPSNGVFGNASRVILAGNYRLCANDPGYSLPLCPESGSQSKHKSTILKIVIPIAVSVVISLLCLMAVLIERRKQKPCLQQSSVNMRKISYEDIAKATDGFSPTNLVGLGSFGAVYNGMLPFETNPVAIKVSDLNKYGAPTSFNAECEALRYIRHRNLVKIITLCSTIDPNGYDFKALVSDLNKYGAPTSFNAECEALRYIRHRNLVKIITLCSTIDPNGYDFKALVFQYMPNGSLEMWLHPEDHGHGKKRFLTLGERISLALDIAYALDYLHNQCVSPVIHCDIKPSNVLLDLEMIAYVSDFGLARFMCANSTAAPGNSTSLADLKRSIGYIAPEYGMGGQISTKGDVYSYGVLLLEILTGKRPTDEKFNDGLSLHDRVDAAFPHRVTEILDPNMLHNDLDGGNSELMQSCLLPLVKVALMCSMASPKDRLGMAQVSTELHSIKQAFLELSSGGKVV